jgi:hypothetical protein
MADDDAPDDIAPENQEQETPTADEEKKPRLFTQEELDSIVRERVAKAKRSKAKQQPAPAFDMEQITSILQESISPIVDNMAAMQAKIDARDAADSAASFESLFTENGRIPDNLKPLLQMKWSTEKPKDGAAWMAECAKQFGTAEPSAETPQDAAKPDTPMPGNNVPSAAKDYSGVINPASLTREDIHHLRASGKYLEVLERYRLQGADGLPAFGRRKIPKG